MSWSCLSGQGEIGSERLLDTTQRQNSSSSGSLDQRLLCLHQPQEVLADLFHVQSQPLDANDNVRDQSVTTYSVIGQPLQNVIGQLKPLCTGQEGAPQVVDHKLTSAPISHLWEPKPEAGYMPLIIFSREDVGRVGPILIPVLQQIEQERRQRKNVIAMILRLLSANRHRLGLEVDICPP